MTNPIKKEGDDSVISEFIESTTAHGFNKLSKATRNIRIVWMCVILLALCAFAAHIVLLVNNYLKYVVTVETIYNSEPFEFPDITICRSTPYHESVWCIRDQSCIDANVKVPSLNNSISIQNAFKNSKSLWQMLNATELSPILARYSIRKYGPETNFTRNVATSVVLCSFKGDKCTPANYHLIYDPLNEACVSIQLQDRQVFLAGLRSKLTFVTSTYDAIGISNVEAGPSFNTNTNRSLIDFNYGYTMYIHPRNTTINYANNVKLPRGKSYNLGLDIEKSISLNNPGSPCLEKTESIKIVENHKVITYKYTKETCQQVKIQEFIAKKCNCLSEAYLVTEDLSQNYKMFCHDTDPSLMLLPYVIVNNTYYQSYVVEETVMINTTCFNSSTNSSYACFSPMLANVTKYRDPWPTVHQTGVYQRLKCHEEAEAEIRINPSISEKCLKACKRISYPFTSTSTDFLEETDAYIKSKLGEIQTSWFETIEWAKANNVYYGELENIVNNQMVDYWSPKSYTSTKYFFGQVTLYANAKKGKTFEEKLSYPPEQFWSDVGGVLGLWAGLSIITVTELFHFTFIFITKLKKKNATVQDSSAETSSKQAWKPHPRISINNSQEELTEIENEYTGKEIQITHTEFNNGVSKKDIQFNDA